MKTTPTAVKDLQVGDRILGGDNSTWEIIHHVRPFNEGTTFRMEFRNVENPREELTRYLPEDRNFAVLTP
jgi:hypothetical protein